MYNVYAACYGKILNLHQSYNANQKNDITSFATY